MFISGRYGAEIGLRRKLEKFISRQRLASMRTSSSIPLICVVVEGGMNTIRTVLEYVTDSPPVPVVVIQGSGRAADLIAFAYKFAKTNVDENDGDAILDDELADQLMAAIRATFKVDRLQAEKLLVELLQCVKDKNLITIFGDCLSDNVVRSSSSIEDQELDRVMLSALFRSRNLSPSEQLSLALAWNRVDIAKSEIFVYGREMTQRVLEEAMMEALIKNSVDFVQLLLEMGVQMANFLTISRLEELYNSNQGPSNTLRYIVADVRPSNHVPSDYTLIDIGLVINKLMGGAYRCSYVRRKFRHIYALVTSKKSTFGFAYKSVL